VNVVVVDDQPLMRSAFVTIMTANGIDVVGEAASGDEAVAVVRRTRPDVVLMDVRMPGGDGLAATVELVGADPAIRVLVLTTFDHDEYVDAALRAGASGFLLKNSTPEELVRAVVRVAAGETVLDPAITGRIVARFASRQAPAHASRALALLTAREEDVLLLLARGQSNVEIAATIGCGEATAKTHVSHVLSKLGVRDRVQAVILAYETGFAPSDRVIG
jgi:DNA-binding NarL/FixJ family response regulator